MNTPVRIADETYCRQRTIAIAGNPNAGKTTLFNALCGTRQKVGNYPGVTVERKTGQTRLPSGETVNIIDLPGCYSLAARSPEEQIAHDVLLGEMEGENAPDLIIVVVDASNLQRNLFLTSQLHDLGIPIIVALNMMDIARERGSEVDPEKLTAALGCAVIPLVARKGEGLDELLAAIESAPCACQLKGGIPRFIDCLPSALEQPVQTLAEGLIKSGLTHETDARGEALWLLVSSLEGDDAVQAPAAAALSRRVRKQYHLSSRQVRAIETSARYRYLKDLMKQTSCLQADLPHRLTNRLDSVLLHRFFGPILFLAVMALVFQSLFSWATPAMDVIESGVSLTGQAIDRLLPDGLFKEMIQQGVVSGVGNVLVFLPQILLLFLFIGFLEDVGYMARAAFLMDRLMSRVGLDGRAFLPLLSSFACAIPGIMATRTIAGRKDRLVTILVAPLMSCSARLPVYTLVIGTVFAAETPVGGIFTVGGLVLMAIYAFSITLGITMAAVFKRTLLKSPPPPLLLELPTYKLPSLKSIGLNLFDRGRLFVNRAGTVILAATVILWAILHIPIHHVDRTRFENARQAVIENSGLDADSRDKALQSIAAAEDADVVEQSLGGHLGKWLEPVIAPLGFDWKIGVGIIASFAAREVFISGLAVVHGVDGADERSPSLRESLRDEKRPGTNTPMYTPLLGLSLLVFFVLACQCLSTVAIARRETSSWFWPAFMVGYMSVLAWVGSFVVYQGGKLLGYS